jgi:hypothetical protein
MTNPKKKIAIGLILVGIVGFIYSQNIKSKYRIFEQRYTTHNSIVQEIKVLNGNHYIFSVWGTDEEQGIQQWADLQGNVELVNPENKILEKKQFAASESEDKGGIKRATNGHDIKYTAEKDENILVKANLIKGDYLDIEVYENLPENAYWLPVICIAVFLAGIVMYLRVRAK